MDQTSEVKEAKPHITAWLVHLFDQLKFMKRHSGQSPTTAY